MAKQLGKLAQRYARALHNAVVHELGSGGSPTPAQQVAATFSEFARVWQEEKELSGSILNPMFDRADRLKALLRVSEMAGMPEVARRGLRVVFEHERTAAVPEIAAAFSAIANRAAGVVPVEIAVARPVAEGEVRDVEAGLRGKIPGDLHFSWRIEPSLLGGMVIRYQGNVVDGSLSSRLEQIERKLRG